MIARSESVPVSEGAGDAATVDAGPFRVTEARFPRGTLIAPHIHDRTCIAFMRRGSFEVRFPGKARVECTPGSLTVEPVGDTHCNCVGLAGADVTVIQPDASIMDENATLRHFLNGIRSVRGPAISSIAMRLSDELANPDDLTPTVLEGLSLELLGAAARLGTKGIGQRPPAWLGRAEEMLRAEFRTAIPLGSLARECGVTTSHLARAFRRYHRCSVGEYVRRLRVLWAAEQLRSTAAPISIVALEAGFADQSHLSRRFRIAFGATPAQWRARQRG